MPQLLPWLPLLLVPIGLTYKHLTDLDDPSFGPKYYQDLIESFSIPNDAHGGSVFSAALHIAFPYTGLLLLYLTAHGKYAMTTNVKVEGVLKSCLRVHAVSFFGYSILGELGPHVMAKFIGSPDLFHADGNTFVLRSALADLFFVMAAMFWLMSIQEKVPRWTTWVPLVQSMYNLMNDVRWMQESVVPGGKVVAYRLNVIDGGVFVSLLISYSYAYVNAIVVDDPAAGKKKN